MNGYSQTATVTPAVESLTLFVSAMDGSVLRRAKGDGKEIRGDGAVDARQADGVVAIIHVIYKFSCLFHCLFLDEN